MSVDPTGSKSGPGSSLRSREPLCAMIQSRRPHARWKGWVFASVIAPQTAVRMWTTKMDDSSRSHAETSTLEGLPWAGPASLSTSAAGSPPG